MASVNSPIRRFVKPLIKRIVGDQGYLWFLLQAKLRDIKYRLVEEPEMELLPKLVREGDQVIDIGANYAYYTSRLSALCSSGEVFAFEPIPNTHGVCKKIVQHLQLKNVSLFQMGVGASTEKVQFQVPLQEIGTPSAGQAHMSGRDNSLPGFEEYHPFINHKTIECEVVALDDEKWSLKFTKVGFIKMDIEGAELFALHGMKNLLQKFKPHLLIEICPYFLKGFAVSERDLYDYIRSLGYQAYRYNQKTKKLLFAQPSFEDGNYLLLHETRLGELRDLMGEHNL